MTPVFAFDRFAVDDRKSGQIVVETAFHGLHSRERLLDLLCDDERGAQQSVRIFQPGPRTQIVNDQTSAADDGQCQCDRGGYDEPRRAKEIQPGRCHPVLPVRVMRGYKFGNPPHFEAMSRLRETRRSLYAVANANNLIIPFSMRFRWVICDTTNSLVNARFRHLDNFRSWCGVCGEIDASAGQFAG